jgi:hypothetical protein
MDVLLSHLILLVPELLNEIMSQRNAAEEVPAPKTIGLSPLGYSPVASVEQARLRDEGLSKTKHKMMSCEWY